MKEVGYRCQVFSVLVGLGVTRNRHFARSGVLKITAEKCNLFPVLIFNCSVVADKRLSVLSDLSQTHDRHGSKTPGPAGCCQRHFGRRPHPLLRPPSVHGGSTGGRGEDKPQNYDTRAHHGQSFRSIHCLASLSQFICF